MLIAALVMVAPHPRCDACPFEDFDRSVTFLIWTASVSFYPSRRGVVWNSFGRALVQAREHVMTDHVSDEQLRMPTPFEHPLAIAIRSGLRFIANFRHYHDRTGARERRHVREVATEQALSESSPPGA